MLGENVPTLVLAAAVASYLLSAIAYGAAFARPALRRTARAALALAGIGFAAQGVAIGLACNETGGQHLLTVAGTLGLVGWFAAGVHLFVQRTARTPAAGALALPLVFAAVLPGLASPVGSGSFDAPALAQIPAVRLHVTTAAGGVALFALACAFGVMYLVQERELKGKRFGPLLSRLPSLHALDRINGGLIKVGFAVFTVAVVSGAVVARTVWCAAWQWDGQLIASLVVWTVFAAMVLARRAGSHGRRQAVQTVLAFTLVVACLVGVRQLRGARHADFGNTEPIACVDAGA
jgi:ABC-type transport system involved in cytochrome c biogenesis permease subunit